MKQKKNSNIQGVLPSSFRDPAGYVYHDGQGRLLRKITEVGLPDFRLATESGLYETLHTQGLLVAHTPFKNHVAIIQPETVFPITYPFEWSFSMLKDAALTTLAIQKQALKHGMSLKDASAYNIQFASGKAQLIDTLSFEAYKEGAPWIAYGQFCRHFLAPLALMAYTDIRLSRLIADYIDGIPLDLAAKLLPKRTRLQPSLLMHLHLHARAQVTKAGDHTLQASKVKATNLVAIIDSLERSIRRLQPYRNKTEWMDYYHHTNYSGAAATHKLQLVGQFAQKVPALTSVMDIGGNDGHYSQQFADKGILSICPDIDPFAVEYNYRRIKKSGSTHMLPLLIDLLNPAGALGWANKERPVFAERSRVDMAMALALVHHLAISNNLPFPLIAGYFATLAPYLIIEFVPKEDSQVQKLLSTRKDIFPQCTREDFEQQFSHFYTIIAQKKVKESTRTLYLMKRK